MKIDLMLKCENQKSFQEKYFSTQSLTDNFWTMEHPVYFDFSKFIDNYVFERVSSNFAF